MNPVQGMERSATRLYRDCLRLVDHIASKVQTAVKIPKELQICVFAVNRSPKGQQLRMILRNEFKKNMGETDPEKIKALKGNAVRGLSNYLVHESGSNDPRLKQRMDALKSHALSDLKQREKG